MAKMLSGEPLTILMFTLSEILTSHNYLKKALQSLSFSRFLFHFATQGDSRVCSLISQVLSRIPSKTNLKSFISEFSFIRDLSVIQKISEGLIVNQKIAINFSPLLAQILEMSLPIFLQLFAYCHRFGFKFSLSDFYTFFVPLIKSHKIDHCMLDFLIFSLETIHLSYSPCTLR